MESGVQRVARLLMLLLASCLGPMTAGRAADRPLLRLTVRRPSGPKSCALGEQLAALQATRGTIQVTSDAAANTAADAELRFGWGPSSSSAAEQGGLAPTIAAADPEAARQALRSAMAGSYGAEVLAAVTAQAPSKAGDTAWEITFPAPRSGASLARQYRVARRLATQRLVALHMLEPTEATWPPSLRPARLLALYDADGAGYYGSTLLERVVAETTLDARTVVVCGEDVREGILDRCIGVLMPGGSGKGIATALEPDGVRRLRDFVAAGGGYVGVCAGAYLAAYGLTEYTGMMPLHHSQPWAKGGATLKFSLTPAGEALLGKEFARFETKYNNGPVFTDLANADVTPLATFESPSTDSKGVVRQEKIGRASCRGRV